MRGARAAVLWEAAGLPSPAVAASALRRPGAKVIRDGEVRPRRPLRSGAESREGAESGRASAGPAEQGEAAKVGPGVSGAPRPAGAAAGGAG